jgi:hypothetical protein
MNKESSWSKPLGRPKNWEDNIKMGLKENMRLGDGCNWRRFIPIFVSNIQVFINQLHGESLRS